MGPFLRVRQHVDKRLDAALRRGDLRQHPLVFGSTIGNAIAAKVMSAKDVQSVDQGPDPSRPMSGQDLVDYASVATGGRPGEFGAPRVAYVDGLMTTDGVKANGAYVPGRNRSDPGTILLDADLARQAQYDEVAQARLGAAYVEESFGSVFARRGISAISVNGTKVDPGGYLAQQYLAGVAASGQGAFRFNLDGQTYAPSTGALSSIMGTTFSAARLQANVTGRGGVTYQVAGANSASGRTSGWSEVPSISSNGGKLTVGKESLPPIAEGEKVRFYQGGGSLGVGPLGGSLQTGQMVYLSSDGYLVSGTIATGEGSGTRSASPSGRVGAQMGWVVGKSDSPDALFGQSVGFTATAGIVTVERTSNKSGKTVAYGPGVGLSGGPVVTYTYLVGQPTLTPISRFSYGVNPLPGGKTYVTPPPYMRGF